MLYTYKECKENYHTDYSIRKAISSGELVKVSRGVYSDGKPEKELEIIGKTI